MQGLEKYKGREQSYVKHQVLQKYLQRLTLIVAMGTRKPTFVLTYIDGFSGPWKTTSEDYSDTSFQIAVNELLTARDV